MERIFTVNVCDRCHKPLTNGRIMSMFNEDIICMDCKDKEQRRPDYHKAVEADHEHIKAGDYNFKGIGF